MLSFRHIGKSAGKRANDSGKELQKLTRQELLSLLLDQTREVDRLRDELVLAQNATNELNAFAERLKAKLDDKDAQISHLKARLDDKDVALQQLFELTREMAEASGHKERLELLLEAEDVLAERYLHQMDSEVPAEVADQAEEASEDIEDVTSANLGSDLPNEEVPSENASASSDHIDYLYAEADVPVVAEEVR